MKLTKYLTETANKLKENPHSSANIEARLLISYILQIDINQLFLKDDLDLTIDQKNQLKKLIKRRVNGEPMAYILGRREFYGNDFIIDKNVLDPRCDSEAMIELIKEQYQNQSLQSLKLIELGIGSGCLIISILMEFKMWMGIGVDISKKAIIIAKKNCQKFDLTTRLKIINGDLFSKIKLKEKFDIIISNPPYIPSAEIKNLQNEVAIFEPKIALDGGLDGLDFYRNIANKSSQFLEKNGSIFLEIGYDQEESVIKIFNIHNFYLHSKKADLANIVRILHFKQV